MDGGDFTDKSNFSNLYGNLDHKNPAHLEQISKIDAEVAKMIYADQYNPSKTSYREGNVDNKNQDLSPYYDFGTKKAKVEDDFWKGEQSKISTKQNTWSQNKQFADQSKQISSLQEQIASLKNKPKIIYKEKPVIYKEKPSLFVYNTYDSPQYLRLLQWSKGLIPEEYSYLKKKELEYYLGKLIKTELAKYSSESEIRNTIRKLLSEDPSYTESKIKSLAPKKPKKSSKKKSKKKPKKKSKKPKKKSKKKPKKPSKKKPKKKSKKKK